MKIDPSFHRQARQKGLTLVEVIVFIVIICVGVVGLLGVMQVMTKTSADPMQRKQAMAIAESLLEEIMLQPFTYCDPELDSAAETASSVAGCTVAQGDGPTATQIRYAEPRFNHVRDYAGFSMNGIRRFEDGTAIGGLEGYRANVVIADANLTTATGDSLQIDVTVNPPNGESITLTGYRFRYAPRAVP